MSNIRFRSVEHQDFFLENMMKCRVNDCYHRAFFYVMGIAGETRNNINRMFDFKNDCIVPEGMHGGWQTSGTVKVCTLPLTSGITMWRKDGKRVLPRKIYSAASLLPTLWRASRSGIPNTAGIYLRRSRIRTMRDRRICLYEEI